MKSLLTLVKPPDIICTNPKMGDYIRVMKKKHYTSIYQIIDITGNSIQIKQVLYNGNKTFGDTQYLQSSIIYYALDDELIGLK